MKGIFLHLGFIFIVRVVFGLFYQGYFKLAQIISIIKEIIHFSLINDIFPNFNL